MKAHLIPRPHWPLIEELEAAGIFSPLDTALAAIVLERAHEGSEAHALAVSYLSLATRQGHLCVSAGNELLPDPITLVDPSLWESLSLSVESLSSNLLHAYQCLPDSLTASESAPLAKRENFVFFRKDDQLEELIVHYLCCHLEVVPLLSFDASSFDKENLLPEQASAVERAMQHAFTIITGGPGTGKTHTAGRLLRSMLQQQTAAGKILRIALAAPTGKAATHLRASLERACGGELDCPMDAMTLHALLKIRQGKVKDLIPRSYLPYDFVMVDEASMLDARLMLALFASVKPGTHLVLLGDPHQLPPVEAGGLFNDLTRALEESEDGKFHLTRLTRCLRAEIQALVHLSQEVRTGNAEGVEQQLLSETAGISWQRIEEGASAFGVQQQLIAYLLEHFEAAGRAAQEEALHAFDRLRVLSPLRRGALGVEALNRRVLEALWNRKEKGDLFIAPIMVVKNDYQKELFNGEVGVLARTVRGPCDASLLPEDEALFPDPKGGIRRIPALLLPPFQYAYCLSVHKSQGSEFEQVVVLLPPGSERFGREVLYTALTRAKREVHLWAEEGILRETVKRNSVRLSGLGSRFHTVGKEWI